MGAQASIGIRVNFDRSNACYFTGEQINGNVSAENIFENVDLEEIYLEFIGEFGYTTEETRQRVNDDKTVQTEHYTQHHVAQFVKIPISVTPPYNSDGEKVVYHGQYSWPFDVIIPKRILPSLTLSSNSHTYIKYYIQVFLDKSYFRSDNQKIYPLTIFPRVDILHLLKSKQLPTFSEINRKDVRLDGYILRPAFLPDEKISIQVNLNNPKQITIKRIEAVLTQYRRIGHDQQENTIFRVDLPDIYEFNGSKYERTVDLALPSQYVLPSYQYQAHCDQKLFPVVIKYELELKVKAHGLFTDFEVKVPIMIGTD